MTRDELKQLTDQAYIDSAGGTVKDILVSFYELITAREREECALLVERHNKSLAAIRARGET